VGSGLPRQGWRFFNRHYGDFCTGADNSTCATNFDRFQAIGSALESGGWRKLKIGIENKRHTSRQNPVLLQKIADKYNLLTADLLQSIDRAQPDQVIAELLRKWKPSGPIN
jgi:hypothetical protein